MSHAFPRRSPWISNVFHMAFPLMANGCPMAFPQSSEGLPLDLRRIQPSRPTRCRRSCTQHGGGVASFPSKWGAVLFWWEHCEGCRGKPLASGVRHEMATPKCSLAAFFFEAITDALVQGLKKKEALPPPARWGERASPSKLGEASFFFFFSGPPRGIKKNN